MTSCLRKGLAHQGLQSACRKGINGGGCTLPSPYKVPRSRC